MPEDIIGRFEKEVLLPLVNTEEGISRDEYKFLKRIIGSAEKQVTCITAYSFLWKLYKGEDVDDMVINKIGDVIFEINGAQYEKFVLPLMEYQLKMRRYLYENVLSTSQASAETEAIDEVWARLVKKVSAVYKPWHDQGGIVATDFHTRVKTHKFFKKNPKYVDPERINRAILSWINTSGLEKKVIAVGRSKRACYVMRN